jgi:CHAD domain-containing protein
MNEENTLVAEPAQVIPADSKWGEGISSNQSVSKVASRVLDSRLKAVCHWLPLAAEKSEQDVEYVHQLRISVRRVVEAVRIFSGLMEEPEVNALRERLRRIRFAADEARNWDVLCERFSHGGGDGILARIFERVKSHRREAQGAVVAVYQEFTADACEAKIEMLVQQVASHRHGEGKQRFRQKAPQHLAPAVRKFFNAAKSDLTTAESLHNLRIRTKKLRYTMEIVAVAFDSAFRKKLYPRVTLFQDLLGTVNDHATAALLFQDWLSKSEDAEQKAFLEGLLLAEERASDDLRAGFLAIWTPKVVSDLERPFGAYH